MMKNIAQRLFGHTIIDALLLKLNAWYIDEAQVTATAAQLNSAGTITPTAKSITASKFGAGLAGTGLLGGNGSPIDYDPAHLHVIIGPGLGVSGNFPVAGMAVGDAIVSVLEFTFAGVMRNSGQYYSAAAGQVNKTNGITNIGGLTWLIWIDNT